MSALSRYGRALLHAVMASLAVASLVTGFGMSAQAQSEGGTCGGREINCDDQPDCGENCFCNKLDIEATGECYDEIPPQID